MSDRSKFVDERALTEAYEREKQRWTAEHPDSSPAEYTAAMQAIAKRLGF